LSSLTPSYAQTPLVRFVVDLMYLLTCHLFERSTSLGTFYFNEIVKTFDTDIVAF